MDASVTESQIRDWYDARHRARGEHAWRPPEAYLVFLDYLEAKPGARLLDVGCGTGHLLRAAEDRGLAASGTDISEEGVQIARRTSPQSNIVVGRGEQLDFPDGEFDFVTCIGALEHFLDMRQGLREMLRVTRPYGRLCIVVPNSNFLYWKLKGDKGTEQHDINENLMSLAEWRAFFTAEPLEIVRVYQDDWFRRRTRVFANANPIGVIKRAAVKVVWTLLPLRMTYQFVFILKKPMA
jgi:ubiquinone/menaquinone biosynthesis C-methylase UbiE